jgi:hypothetical protein
MNNATTSQANANGVGSPDRLGCGRGPAIAPCRDCWNCLTAITEDDVSADNRCPWCAAIDPHGRPQPNAADEPRAPAE